MAKFIRRIRIHQFNLLDNWPSDVPYVLDLRWWHDIDVTMRRVVRALQPPCVAICMSWMGLRHIKCCEREARLKGIRIIWTGRPKEWILDHAEVLARADGWPEDDPRREALSIHYTPKLLGALEARNDSSPQH